MKNIRFVIGVTVAMLKKLNALNHGDTEARRFTLHIKGRILYRSENFVRYILGESPVSDLKSL